VEVTKLDSPIDAMYLIHKALRAEAVRVEQMASELEVNGSLQPFRLAFSSWAIALEYHAETEDKYVTPALSTCQPVGSSEVERVKTAMAVLDEVQHRELVGKMEGVLTVLDEEIGKTSVIVRTKQHLYRQVVALRIAQEDHLETEEALVLPTLRQRLSEQQQLEVAKHLLIDEEAQEVCWMLDWVTKELTPGEKNLLANLEARFKESPG
jgi:hemerythrin-like domain-containing protein